MLFRLSVGLLTSDPLHVGQYNAISLPSKLICVLILLNMDGLLVLNVKSIRGYPISSICPPYIVSSAKALLNISVVC